MYRYIIEPLVRKKTKQAYLDLRYFKILSTLKYQKTKYIDHLRAGTK